MPRMHINLDLGDKNVRYVYSPYKPYPRKKEIITYKGKDYRITGVKTDTAHHGTHCEHSEIYVTAKPLRGAVAEPEDAIPLTGKCKIILADSTATIYRKVVDYPFSATNPLPELNGYIHFDGLAYQIAQIDYDVLDEELNTDIYVLAVQCTPAYIINFDYI